MTCMHICNNLISLKELIRIWSSEQARQIVDENIMSIIKQINVIYSWDKPYK